MTSDTSKGAPISEIEAESYRIMESKADFTRFGELEAIIAKRCVHASADFEYIDTLRFHHQPAEAAISAIQAGAPVICDVEMVRSGMNPSAKPVCYLPRIPEGGSGKGKTRSAEAIELSAMEHPEGALFVVGCAPTALFALVSMVLEGDLRPAAIFGLPVGFVGAAESKEALRELQVPSVSNVGNKGGSAVAAAAFNSVYRVAGQVRSTSMKDRH